jgi:hypothetical protein
LVIGGKWTVTDLRLKLAGTFRFVVISEALVEKGNEFDFVESSCDEEGLSDISNPSSRDAGAYAGYRKLLRNAF